MTPQFLRSEAARFRDMAEAADREASRQRLLAMALDYEARAKVAEAAQPLEPIREAEPETEAETAPVADQPIEVKPERKRSSGRTLRLAR